jgi:hypothetical protein
MTRLKLFAAAGVFLCAGVAEAGVVRVVTNISYGQGWMFLDYDGVCKVATAGHVVKLADGRVASRIQIVDEKGHTPQLGEPLVLSDNPDIAVLPVIGGNDPSVCGDGRLSAIGVARRVKETTSARIETTEQDGIVRVPVRWRAAAADSGAGSIFAVQPTNPADHIVKGWSGSVVLDDDGLLGIVFEVDDASNEAYAVRADVIRGLIDAARPNAAAARNATSAQAPVVQLAGSTPDPNHGPYDVYRTGDSGWDVVPDKGRIAFMVVFDKPFHLQGVALAFSSAGNAPTGMDVAASAAPDSENWASLNYCPIAKGDASIRCPVVTSTVSRIRVSLKTGSGGAMVLSGLTFMHE